MCIDADSDYFDKSKNIVKLFFKKLFYNKLFYNMLHNVTAL